MVLSSKNGFAKNRVVLNSPENDYHFQVQKIDFVTYVTHRVKTKTYIYFNSGQIFCYL